MDTQYIELWVDMTKSLVAQNIQIILAFFFSNHRSPQQQTNTVIDHLPAHISHLQKNSSKALITYLLIPADTKASVVHWNDRYVFFSSSNQSSDKMNSKTLFDVRIYSYTNSVFCSIVLSYVFAFSLSEHFSSRYVCI